MTNGNGHTMSRIRNLETQIERLLSQDIVGGQSYAWGTAVSSMLALPGLVGLWPGGVGRGSSSLNGVTDVSGNGLHLTRNGTLFIARSNLAPLIAFDGATGYLSHSDAAAFDISGTEAIVFSSIKGLTIGGWFRYDNTASSVENMIGKRTGSGNLSYYLRRTGAGNLNFQISDDGTNTRTVETAGSAIDAKQTWYFLIGRFDPSAELAAFINGEKTSVTSSIPASIHNSTAPFTIGANGSPDEYFQGGSSLPFLCAAALSDDIITNLYEQTRHLFGV